MHVVLLLYVLTGVAYTSECFPCRPGWFSPAPGSSSCEPCPSNTFSIKDAASCTPCPEHHYSRTYTRNNSRLSDLTHTSCGSFVGFIISSDKTVFIVCECGQLNLFSDPVLVLNVFISESLRSASSHLVLLSDSSFR